MYLNNSKSVDYECLNKNLALDNIMENIYISYLL